MVRGSSTWDIFKVLELELVLVWGAGITGSGSVPCVPRPAVVSSFTSFTLLETICEKEIDSETQTHWVGQMAGCPQMDVVGGKCATASWGFQHHKGNSGLSPGSEPL